MTCVVKANSCATDCAHKRICNNRHLVYFRQPEGMLTHMGALRSARVFAQDLVWIAQRGVGASKTCGAPLRLCGFDVASSIFELGQPALGNRDY